MFEEHPRRHDQGALFDPRDDGRRAAVRQVGAIAISLPATMAPSGRAFARGPANANLRNAGISWLPLAAIGRIAAAIGQLRRNARLRQDLHGLTDHTLQDIGLRRESLDHEPVNLFCVHD
jgi:uncharacterized protein YjiS (DUF1127 family)